MQQNEPFDMKDFRLPKINVKAVGLIVVVIILISFVSSLWFTVSPEEVGVVLRFGKYDRTVNPGLNFKLPLGVETVHKVPVERQLKLEFGFRAKVSGVRTQYSSLKYEEESLMLTGDLNAAEVEWIVQYRINDPYKYLFRVRNADQTFRDINEAVMRGVVGDRTVDEVITFGRQEVADTVSVKLQELCDQYELGIKVEQVVLQDANAPESVQPAFNEVNAAEQEKDKLINQAKSEYNKVIPRARGIAKKTIEEAKGYALERVNNALGEASKFNSVFAEYSKAKEVTRQRIYLETMNEVMQNVGRKLITDEEMSGMLPLLQLDMGGAKK
jgi:membrane protease subunit HflK